MIPRQRCVHSVVSGAGARALLVLALRLVFTAGALQSGKASTYVTSPSEFIAALRDPSVALITLSAGVFNLEAVVSTSASGGIKIGPNRHLDIVGNMNAMNEADYGQLGWLHSSAFAYHTTLDFGLNGAGLLRLADNTSLGFQDIILLHGLSQLAYDWQVVNLSQPTARASVQFTRTVKLREGCLPLQIFVQHVTSYTRLIDRPGPQVASLKPFCYTAPPDFGASIGLADLPPYGNASALAPNVSCMAEVLAITDLATSIMRPSGQSYRLYEQNSTYWCRAYASMACLSGSGPEQCVRDLFAAPPPGPAAPAGGAPPNGSASPDGGSAKATNILLPAVLTGVLAIAFITATVWCIYRRAPGKRGSSLGAVPGLLPGDGDAGDLEHGFGGGAAVASRPAGAGARVGGALARLLPRGARAAWQRKPDVPGYVPAVNKDALDRIAKVRAELSSKMVVASSADDLSDVRNLHLVGKGTFGRVYKGEWKGVTVALKVIPVPVSQCGQAQWQQVLGEAAISTLLNHPCVLQTYSVALLEYTPARKAPSSASEDCGNNLLATWGAVNGPGGGANNSDKAATPVSVDEISPFYQLKMVSEFCERGSVVNALHRMLFYDSSVGGGTVRLPAIVDIASQVASGMAYLHSANIIHADLKAANVLLKQQPGSGRLQAKVADFGLSFRMDEPEATHVTKGQLGSITHMAPEVLMHGRVSKSSDVYSFGILLFELYTGQPAYCDVPQPMLAYHVATAGVRPQLPPHCPTGYRAIAKACWSAEPSERPTFTQVYKSLNALADSMQRYLADPAAAAAATAEPEADPTAEPAAAAAGDACGPTPPGSRACDEATLAPKGIQFTLAPSGDRALAHADITQLPSTALQVSLQAPMTQGSQPSLPVQGLSAPPPSRSLTGDLQTAQEAQSGAALGLGDAEVSQ